VVAQSLVRILANRGQKQGLSLGNKLATNVTIQGSQIVDSQSLAKAKKNDPEYKPISRTKYTY
jgi:hypothetical protein